MSPTKLNAIKVAADPTFLFVRPDTRNPIVSDRPKMRWSHSENCIEGSMPFDLWTASPEGLSSGYIYPKPEHAQNGTTHPWRYP